MVRPTDFQLFRKMPLHGFREPVGALSFIILPQKLYIPQQILTNLDNKIEHRKSARRAVLAYPVAEFPIVFVERKKGFAKGGKNGYNPWAEGWPFDGYSPERERKEHGKAALCGPNLIGCGGTHRQ